MVRHLLGVGDDFGEAGSAAAVNGRVDELNARLSRLEAGHEHQSPRGHEHQSPRGHEHQSPRGHGLGACRVARVGLPLGPQRAACYAADRLHLSAAGYEALVP